jgi:hypothetical protein
MVSVVATIAALALIDKQSLSSDTAFFAKFLMTCSLAMPVMFSFHAMYEVEKKKGSFILLGVGILMLGLFFRGVSSAIVGHDISQIWVYRFFMWNGAFHLLAAFCTFYILRETNGFWQWNRNLFLGFLLAALYALVLYAGLAIAIVAITQLFNIDVDEKIYAKLWVVIALMFQPLIFLGATPRPIQRLQEDVSYPNGLRIFTQYILLPLVVIYFLILYVYMGKIIVQWNLPKGWVSYLIISFSVSGILSLLLLHPLIEKEEYSWVRWVNRLYYFLLIPLVGLMLISIGIRIQQYGITPNRYIILVLAIWLGLLSLYFTFFPKRNIILIPISLAVLGVFCSFGPWGIFEASINSQMRILEQTLKQNHLFQNGKFVVRPDTLPPPSSQVSGQIQSTIDLLNHLNYGDNLSKWIPKEWEKDSLVDAFQRVNTSKLSQKLGIPLNSYDYQDPTAPRNIDVFCPDIHLTKGLDIGSGYTHLGAFLVCLDGNNMCYSPNFPEGLDIQLKENLLILTNKKDPSYDTLSLASVINFLQKDFDLEKESYLNGNAITPDKMTVEKIGKYRILMTSLQLSYQAKKPQRIQKVEGYVLWKK